MSENFNKATVLITRDANVARPCDRIMRIGHGVIKASYTPVEFEEGATFTTLHVGKLRDKIDKLDAQLLEFENGFRKVGIDADKFVEQRLSPKQTKIGLEDEPHRLGKRNWKRLRNSLYSFAWDYL